ncbi:MAG: hypothetical protein ABR971_09500 [Acidobacteriaceae bacterium]
MVQLYARQLEERLRGVGALLRFSDPNVREAQVREANPKVNSVRKNGPELLQQAERAAASGQLPL